MSENEIKESKENGNKGEEGWEEVKEADLFEFKNKGDNITGTLISVEKDVGKFKSKMYTLKQENGKTIKIWGSKLLDDRLITITFGTLIKIVFVEEVIPDKGNTYKDFKIYKQPAKRQ